MNESVTPSGEPERWLPVADYEGLYEVSSLGRIRGLDRMIATVYGAERRWRGRVMKPAMLRRYLGLRLWRDGVARHHFVHVLVARAFLGPCPEGHQVCHGPAGALDNRPANLSYGTPSKNNGEDRRRDGTLPIGSLHGSAKLTEEIVRECRARVAAGATWRELGREFGVHGTTVRRAVTGANWQHVAGRLAEDEVPPPRLQGERHRSARLTEEAVRDIRVRHAEGSASAPDLARLYGVSGGQIRGVINRKSWKHVA